MAWHQLLRRLLGLLAAALCAGAIGILAANAETVVPAPAKPPSVSWQPTVASDSSRHLGSQPERPDASVLANEAACRPPLLVAVGASYTAGVGALYRLDAWPYQLARLLGWRVVAKGVPGAGYVRPGWHGGGPLSREVAELHLRRVHPSLVIIQSGHNDIGEPLPLLRQRVRRLIDMVRDEAPRSAIALLTVFIRADHRPTEADWVTDRTIVGSARQADPRVVVFDPLAGHWDYPRPAGRLHPRFAGYRWIARRLDHVLLRDGIVPPGASCTSGMTRQ